MPLVQRFQPSRRGAVALLAASLVASGLLLPGRAAGGDVAPVKILTLGDSITEGHADADDPTPLTYRYSLDARLDGGGHAFDLVGTVTGRAGRVEPLDGFDADHEGHGGWRVDNVLHGRNGGTTSLDDWLATLADRGDLPDIALVHLGTNDIRQCEGASSTADELRQVVEVLQAASPTMTVLLAEIIPAADFADVWIGSVRCGTRTVADDIAELNAAVRALATATSTATSSVISVDQHRDFSVVDDLADGVHPNAEGDVKLADRWYDALLTSTGAWDIATTTTTTTVAPTTTTTVATTTTTTTSTTTTTVPPTTTTTTPAPPPAPPADGYWLVDQGGGVHAFGAAVHRGDASSAMDGARAMDLEPTPSGGGYWILDDRGGVHPFGDAAALGHVDRASLDAGERVTSLSATRRGDGYWVFTTRGRALAFGAAVLHGDMAGAALNAPVLDSIVTPSGAGYWMVAADGGIFSFGDAGFHGSTGDATLNSPVQSLVADPDGEGYWLVAGDGGVFAFAATFQGSMGGQPLNRPMTGMVPYGDGYLMVAEDGGVFTFSDRPFQGSLGAAPPAAPVVAIASVP